MVSPTSATRSGPLQPEDLVTLFREKKRDRGDEMERRRKVQLFVAEAGERALTAGQ